MACGNCGNVNCNGCSGSNVLGSGVILTPVECSTRPCSPADRCSTPGPATPAPYYQCAPTCQEDHCQQVNVFNYATSICVNYAFNMPACGETANIYFTDVKNLLVGAYLWHPTYGYLEVVGFNNQTGQAIVKNNCNDGNAAVGTNIPACTCFVVTATPVDLVPEGAMCVALDFIAPEVGECVTIAVTNVVNVGEGDLVLIGTGRYRVNSIVSATLLEICNDGEGITPGTIVYAKDSLGNFQYCLSVVSNCCTVIEERFGGTLEPCSDFENRSDSSDEVSAAANTTPLSLNISETATRTVILSITNPSDCRSMLAVVNLFTLVSLSVNTSNPGGLIHAGVIQTTEQINVEAPTDLYPDTSDVFSGSGIIEAIDVDSSDISLMTLPHTKIFTVAPGNTLTLSYTSTLTGSGTNGCNYLGFYMRGTLLGIAV